MLTLAVEEGRVRRLGEKGNLTFTTFGSCKLNLEQIAEAPKNEYLNSRRSIRRNK